MRTPRWLTTLYFVILLLGILVALPNLLTEKQLEYLPSFMRQTKVVLGLDLRGGSSLVLEVDAKSLKRDQLRTALDNVRGKLREKQIQSTSVRMIGDSIVAVIPDAGQRQTALTALKELATPISAGAFRASDSDIDVAEQNDAIRVSLTDAGIKYRVNNAVDQSLEIIRRRVD